MPNIKYKSDYRVEILLNIASMIDININNSL